jgi:hypothetical protein
VAFSPDGTKIVSGSADKTIKVWDSGAPQALKIAPYRPKLTPAGLSGSQAGATEREDERPQRPDQVSGVFPGRDQDHVGIWRHDDQSLGYGQVVSQRSFDVQWYHPAIRLAAAVDEQEQYEVSGWCAWSTHRSLLAKQVKACLQKAGEMCGVTATQDVSHPIW